VIRVAVSWRTVLVAALALVVAGALSPARAQSPPDDTVIEARVDMQQMGEGDSLTLTIEVRGSRPAHAEEPDLSGLADFNIAAGPSTSTSTSMIWRGGQASSSTSQQYSYILLPRRRGTLTIPTISVKVGSRVLRTDPISVEVVAGRVRQSGPSMPGRGGAPGLPQRPGARPQGEVFVEAQVDRKEAWVGEQVLLTYKVYTQVELVELPHPQQLPSYTGFWVEELPNDPRATVHRVTRDGKEFIELTLMKKAIFPTASGALTIEETPFELPVRAETRDPFEGIFFTPTRLVYRKTNPITIQVKPLPEAGRPASFTGAVGSYTLTTRADRTEARVNEAVGLQIRVEGKGNIKVVGEPLLPALPDYKRYEPKVEEKREVQEDRLLGTKTWDYVLTPLAAGPQDLPAIAFAYFDPSRGAYVEVTSKPLPVMVQRGADGGTTVAGGTAPGARREVVAFGRDIRFIKGSSQLDRHGTPFHRSLLFGALLASPLLLNAALLFAVRRHDRLAASVGLVRGRRAPGFARRRLKQARRILAEGKPRAFSEEVGRALTGYLADRLNVSASGLTHERIDGLLEVRRVDAALRGEVKRVLEACDFARFAPVEQGPDAMRRDLEEAEQLIARLEREAFTARRAGIA
jgi:hypothetical protein